MKKSNYTLSAFAILLIASCWIYLFVYNKPWEKNHITTDVVSYYGYLPAFVIYKDLTLKFTDSDPFFSKYYWPEKSPNGGRVIKTTMGLSLLYSPFFFIGHLTAPFFHQPR